MKLNAITLTILSLTLFISCTGTDPIKRPAQPAENSEPMPGSDRDAHGCIGSAGYTWSEVLQDCIRIFEKGTRLESAGGDTSVYIVFGPDSSQVELFFSNSLPTEILDRRRLPSGASAWNVEDDDTHNLRRMDGSWEISRRGITIYKEIPK